MDGKSAEEKNQSTGSRETQGMPSSQMGTARFAAFMRSLAAGIGAEAPQRTGFRFPEGALIHPSFPRSVFSNIKAEEDALKAIRQTQAA